MISLQAATAQAAPNRAPPAQVAASPATPTPAPAQSANYIDGKVLSFDVGLATGYNLAGTIVAGRSIGFSFILSDSVALGFTSITAGSASYSLMRAGYTLANGVGLDLYAGTDGSTAAGLDASIRFLASKSENGVCSALKVRLGYLFDSARGIGSGDVLLALSTSVGI